MLTFRLLGGIGLTDSSGNELDALLRQPKHVALLAYLSLPQPGTWHRRDTVLGTFWPETDQSRARAALRSALYTLRQHLPDRVIRSRGDDDLSIDPELLRTDVSVLAESFAAGQSAKVLEQYEGELLNGLFIGDAPGFEKWLETERSRVRGIVRRAASQLSQQLELRGDLPGAIDAAKRASQLEPDDESAARRWIALLDLAGDRSQAFAVYERFRNHMSESFGVRPSAETVALLDAIRTRREMSGAVDVSQPVRRSVSTPGDTVSAAPRRSRRVWLFAAVPLVLAAVGFILLKPDRPSSKAIIAPGSLVVLPMENSTGDPSLDYLAEGIAEDVAHRLNGFAGMKVHSGARSDWKERTHGDTRTIAHALGSNVLLRTRLTMVRDSLRVAAEVIDATSSGAREISSRTFLTNGIRDVESRVAADVIGALFRKALPEDPHDASLTVDPESYRYMLRGWHTMLGIQATGAAPKEYSARDDFSKATDIDPSNARAWAGLSSVWASLTVAGHIPFADGSDRVSAAALHALAIDSLQGSAWANLGITRGLKYNNLEMGLTLVKKGQKAEPSNPELYQIESVLYRAARQFDNARDAMRVARSLDPLSLALVNQEGQIEFCADRPEEALRIYEAERQMNPQNPIAVNGVVRSLALLGRYDEALALWRSNAESRSDSTLAQELSRVSGERGYWDMRHREGKKRLETLLRTEPNAAPFRIIQAQLAAGDPEAAYKTIDDAPASEKPSLYRLACYAPADEYRRAPRFVARIQRIGALRLH